MAKKKLEVIIAGDAKGAAGAFGDAEKSADGFSGKLKGIGDKLGPMFAAAGVAAGAALIGGLMGAMDDASIRSGFENRLGVSTEVAAEMGKATAAAWADGFGGSKAEVAAAAEAVNTAFGDSIDYDSASLQPLIEQATALADVFELDVNEAMSAAGTLLRNGLVADGQEGLDVLTAGLQGLAPAVREEVLAATNEYSKHFSALGMDAEEALRLFRSADGVIGVDKIGDALKELTIRSTDMSTTSVAAYDAMGLSAQDMSTRMLAGGDTARGAMDEIIDGLLGIEDPVEQANTAIALFGTPIEDLGTDQIPSFLRSLDNMGGGLGDVSGSAQEMADKLNSGPMAKIEQFKRTALQGLADIASNIVIPAIEKLVGWFSENKWAIGPLAIAIGTVLVGAFAAWAIAAGGAAIATLAASAPLIAIGVAIAAVAAGFVWAYNNVDWFRSAVDAVASFLTGTVWPALQAVASYLIGETVRAFQLASDAVGWLIEKGTALWGWISANLLPILGTVATFLVGAFTAAWSAGSAAVGWVIEKGTELYGWFSANVLPILQTVGAFLVAGFSAAFDAGKAAIGFVITKASEMWAFFTNQVLPILQTVAGYIEGGFSTAFDAGKAAVGWVVDRVDDLWDALNSILEIAGNVASAISNLPGAGIVSGIIGSVPGFASGGVPPIGEPYWVGERGPELRIDTGPGVIIPNHRTSGFLDRGGRPAGGDTVIIQIHNSGSVVTERELIDVVSDGLEKARRRDGRSLVVAR